MSLKYEPSSEPLHISAKQLFRHVSTLDSGSISGQVYGTVSHQSAERDQIAVFNYLDAYHKPSVPGERPDTSRA